MTVAMASTAMVATPHYLATATGLRVLSSGGNAVDAAIAASATLCVVYPHMTGLGGDLMALVWDARRSKLHALNASGRAPAAATPDVFRGLEAVPEIGGLSVTVPGAVHGWGELHTLSATRALDELLAPAAAYADGAPVCATVVDRFERYQGRLERHAAPLLAARPRSRGERWAQPALAATLREIGRVGIHSFYSGHVAEAIVAAVREAGGPIVLEDLATHCSEWVESIRLRYLGLDVIELPPSTQGVTALELLAIAERLRLPALWSDPVRVHLLAEATAIAMADRDQFVADPEFTDVPVARLLAADRAREIADQIVSGRRPPAAPVGSPALGDTVHIAVADRDGNLVSLSQSLFDAFGSGVYAESAGVLLHDRGAAFALSESSPNRIAPRKRPLHTLIPAFAFRDGVPWLAFGTMGGHAQPQVQAQLLGHLLEGGADLQEAVSLPRWYRGGWLSGEPPDTLHLEDRFPAATFDALAARGHRLVRAGAYDPRVGHAQAILVDRAAGAYHGAADPRADGVALGW